MNTGHSTGFDHCHLNCDSLENGGRLKMPLEFCFGGRPRKMLVQSSLLSRTFVTHLQNRKPCFINGFEAIIYASYLRDRTLASAPSLS
jgi:hypothetical protein